MHYLLDNGADVNSGLDDGFDDPLYAAANQGCEGIVRILRSHGADITLSAILTSVLGEHDQIAQFLLKESIHTHRGAFSAASFEGREKVVRSMLEQGVDAEILDAGLVIASKSGHEKVVQLLLNNAADANTKASKRTVLQWASRGGHEEVSRLLLDSGADINAHGGWSLDDTALKLASRGGFEKVVLLLLERGAEVGGNAVVAASKQGHAKVVQLLLDRVADTDSEMSALALSVAMDYGKENVVQLLLSMGIEICQ